ncbi:GNAT family N-acetyltransferase [Phytomonospora sp. NPDC050363]|uniref:GNAT family N-acetyltransferase n=1 Tax=Phytomonospora sp. NPDC050363 TaxID=3155642 RepID=UPI0033EB061C
MTTVDIRRVDPADEATVEAVFDVKNACWAHDLPDNVPPTLDEERLALTALWPGQLREDYVAVAGGRVVAHLCVELSTLENLHNAWAEISVHPDFRRRGIGRTLWAHANIRAADQGRTNMGATACKSVEGGIPRGHHGIEFLGAMGLEPKLAEERRRIEFGGVDWDAMDALLAESWKHAEGYRVRTWTDNAPDDLVEGLAYLDGRLILDAPMGDLDFEAPKVDAERFRASEATADARGRIRLHVAMQHEETGKVAAWTMIVFGPAHVHKGFQGITIVDPEHRGRRLGTVAKLELHRFVRAEAPALVAVDTWNAASNAYMIKINEQIGYRVVDSWVDYQGEVATP